jgi:archaellum component FlaF (FlaF/FlaG flagellin family)
VENVLAAFIILFTLLFGVLTLADAMLSAQDELLASWEGVENRLDEQSRTRLSAVEAHTGDAGSTIELTLRNEGDTRLADFDQWDVILQHYDTNTPAVYHIAWKSLTLGF